MDEQCTLKESLVALMSGVKIHGFHFPFSQYDGTTRFEALDLIIAEDFILQAITQTHPTETLCAISAEEL